MRWISALALVVALTPSLASAADPPKQFGVLRRVSTVTPTPQLADLPSNPLATPTPVPKPNDPSPTPEPTIALDADLPDFAARVDAVRGAMVGRQLLLEVPPRTQFDGTPYQSSNCGPTAMAMVLEAFGLKVDAFKLRNYVNNITGDRSVENGVALDYLAYIASEAGLQPAGLRAPGGYRRWTVPEIREEVRHGHPVITLVKLRELPDHNGSWSQVDHYVVVVGMDGENLLINDPASAIEGGYRRPLAPAQLERAWAASSIPGQALAVAGGAGVPELNLPDPAVDEVGWLVKIAPADAEDRRKAAARAEMPTFPPPLAIYAGALRLAAPFLAWPFAVEPPRVSQPEVVEYAGQPPPICALAEPLPSCRADGAT
jgi:uncharacterized protein YvpB